MKPSSVKSAELKPINKIGDTVIVLFSGKPNFRGLDDGIFVSSKNKNASQSSIYVMTEASFKLFNWIVFKCWI